MVFKKQICHFADKGLYSQNYGFSSHHVQMWELDRREVEHQKIDAFKLWCWGRLLRVPRTARTSNQSILKETNSAYSSEGQMLAPKLWLPDAKSGFIGKYPDAGKDWRQKEKGATEDEMARWHHWLSGHEFEQTQGESEDRACCSPWGHKESNTT